MILFNSRSPEPHCWLSTFYPFPFIWDGREWPSVEHCYQAWKTLDSACQEFIRTRPSAAKARKAGQNCPSIRGDWELIRLGAMRSALLTLYVSNDRLAEYLLSTEHEVLVHDAPWDAFWGSPGQNHLGVLLMDIRQRMQASAGKNGESP